MTKMSKKIMRTKMISRTTNCRRSMTKPWLIFMVPNQIQYSSWIPILGLNPYIRVESRFFGWILIFQLNPNFRVESQFTGWILVKIESSWVGMVLRWLVLTSVSLNFLPPQNLFFCSFGKNKIIESYSKQDFAKDFRSTLDNHSYKNDFLLSNIFLQYHQVLATFK